MRPNPGNLGCTCYHLRQTTRLVSRIYDSFLAPASISIGQFGVLATLNAMQAESISSVAEVLQMDRSTLTRNLNPLTRLGYIAITEGADKRARSLHLTTSGKQTYITAKPLWRAAQRHLEKTLGKATILTLNRTLEQTMEGIDA